MTDPAHLTDAELAAWYGSGLHAPKAQRLIEEVRRLRTHLAEVEAERDEIELLADELEESKRMYELACDSVANQRERAEAAEARLAAVEALHTQGNLASDCDCFDGLTDCPTLAAARGEGDRPTTQEHNSGTVMSLGCGEGDRPAVACCDSDDYAGHVCTTCYYQHCHCPDGTPGPIRSGEGDRSAETHKFYPTTLNGGGKVACGEWLAAEGRMCKAPERDPIHSGEGDRPAVDRAAQYIAERDADLLRRLGEGPT